MNKIRIFITLIAAVICAVHLSGINEVFASDLNIVYPESGKQIHAKNNIDIVWEGIAPKQKVKIEYSSDGGVTWSVISDDSRGLNQKWPVQDIRSDKCVMKIRTLSVDHNYYDKGTLTAVEVSPDGKLIAGGGSLGIIYVWDAENGDLKQEMYGHNNKILSLSWSPDSKELASSGIDSLVIIWDATNNRIINSMRTFAYAVAWSPDGEKLATPYYIRDANTLEKLVELKDTTSGYGVSFNCLTWSPDGSMIAGTDRFFFCFIWDTHSGEIKDIAPGSDGWIGDLAWSPDGSVLAYDVDTGSIYFRNVNERKLVKSIFYGYGREIYSLAWDPDGQKIAAGYRSGGLIEVYNYSTGELISADTIHYQDVFYLHWMDDNNLISAGTDGKIHKLNLTDHEVIMTPEGTSAPVKTLIMNDPGSGLVFSTKAGEINSLKDGQFKFVKGFKRESQLTGVVPSPDGSKYAVCIGDYHSYIIKIYICDSQNFGIINEINIDGNGKLLTSNIAWNKDGTEIAASLFEFNQPDKLVILSAADGQVLKSFENDDFLNSTILWDWNGGKIIAGTNNGNIIVVDDESGEMNTIEKFMNGNISCYSLNPDRSLLAVGDNTGLVKICNSATLDIQTEYQADNSVNTATWSHDGTMLAIGNGNNVDIIDPETAELTTTLIGHFDKVNSILWSDDDARIYTGSEDGTIIEWFPEKGIQSDVTDGYWSIIEPLSVDRYNEGNMETSNYPNPFTGSTNISFTLNESTRVTVKIINSFGSVVKTLVSNEYFDPGTHNVRFYPENLSPGIYYYIIQTGNTRQNGKVVYVK